MVQPTSAQEQVRDHPDLALLIVAPAGCGKTEALALRVKGLLDRKTVEAPHRVLAATFSNRARDNLRQRLTEYLPPATLRDRVTVSNFHGLAARIIRAHGNMIGISDAAILPDGDWVGARCREDNLSFPAGAAVKALLGRIKRQPLTDTQVEAALVASGNSWALALERQRVRLGLLTYDDLPRLAELILAEDGVASLYRAHFGAVIVDEFQDLTPQQLRIVNRIGFKRTTFAGDLAQGIYGFAGADPAAIDATIRAECTVVIPFTDSHRSSPAVLGMVNALSPLTGGQKLTCANPSRWPGDGLAAVIGFSGTKNEADWAVGFATEVLRKAPTHRVAILARTLGRRRFVDEAVAQSGLPHFRWEDGVLDTETASVVRAMLARLDLREFVAADDQVDFLRHLAGVAEIQDPGLRESLSSALDWCVDLLRQGQTPESVRGRIRIGDNETLLTKAGVHLLTGHNGKGQQFDWVVVVGAEEGTIPDFRATTPAEVHEEARVLSVMVSRARHGVVVTHSRQVLAGTGRMQTKQPSQFLPRFSNGAAVDAVQASAWLRTASWAALAAT